MISVAIFTLLSIRRIMSPSLNLLLSIRPCIEVHIWALEPKSNTQLEVEETVRLDLITSIPSKSLSPFLIFRLSKYFGQFLLQWPSVWQWKYFSFASSLLGTFFFGLLSLFYFLVNFAFFFLVDFLLEEIYSTTRIVPLKLFKVFSVVTNILISSGIVQSSLFI